MKFKLVINYTDPVSNFTKYLVENKEGNYEFLSYTDPSINAWFNRFDAENKIYRILFPEDKKRKLSRDLLNGIQYFEFTKMQQLCNDNLTILDVKAVIYIPVLEPYLWVDSEKLESSNDFFNKYFDNKSNKKQTSLFNYKSINFINKLVDASRRNKLVLFIGSGFSKNYGYPLWGELLEDIKQKYGISETNDPLKFAQLFYNTVGHNEYYSYLRSIFLKSPVKPTIDLLKEIFKIDPNAIITTNYDNLLENSSYNLDYQVISANEDLAYSKSSRFILKMHGDFKKDNIVFKEDDYLSYSKTHQLIEYYVQSLIASKTFLIIGFSYDDINLKYIVQRIKDIHQKDFNRICIFFTESHIPEVEIKYYESKGLDVLCCNDDLLSFLNISFNKGSNIPGDSLYYFLTLLNLSINNEIGIEIKNPVEQAFSLFEKYKHLPTVSPYTLYNYKPFTESENGFYPKYIPEEGCLNFGENEFWRRFNQISFNFTNISDSIDYKSLKISNEELKWWDAIFKVNGLSCVYFYGLNGGNYYKRSFTNDGVYLRLYDLKKEGKIKELLQNCLELAFDTEILMEKLSQYNEAVYYLVYFGKTSYAAIIGTKLLSYYIQGKDFYNALRLITILSDLKYQVRNGFNSDFTKEKELELFNLIDEYNESLTFHNFNLTLFERINYINVFGEEISLRLLQDAKKYFDSFERDFLTLRTKNAELMGPNYPEKIFYLFNFIYFQHYYNSNPKLFYSNRKDFVNIFIYTNLISINIDRNYHSYNSKGLDDMFLSIFLNYFNPNDLLSFYKKYNDINVRFNNETRLFFEQYLKNYIDSLVEYDFMNNLCMNDVFEMEMKKNIFFKQEVNYKFIKILWTLTRLDDNDLRDRLLDQYINKIYFVIYERIIYDYDVLPEFLGVLLDVNIDYYIKILNSLSVSDLSRRYRLEIFFRYLSKLFENYGQDVLNNNFEFIFKEFYDLNGTYQSLLIQILAQYNIKFLANFALNIDLNRIKFDLLKSYFIYLRQGKIRAIEIALSKEIDDSNIRNFTDESVFYINDENTAKPLYLILNDNKIKYRLKNKSLGLYYKFALYPNEFNYLLLNSKWLLTGHSFYNIKFLSKETILIWLSKLSELKSQYPEILIDHMFKNLGEAIGKLNK